MPTMDDIRVNVTARVQFLNDSAKNDIMDPTKTQDNLVRALDIQTAPVEKGGHAYKILITALNSDHHDDSALGPHSHHAGWAVDVGTINGIDVGYNDTTINFVRTLIISNKFVTKVGTLPAVANRSDLQAEAQTHGVVLFEDVGTGAHVHFQSA